MNNINGHTDGYRGGYDASMHASDYAEDRMAGFVPLTASKRDLWACARLASWNALRFSTSKEQGPMRPAEAKGAEQKETAGHQATTLRKARPI